MSSEKTYPLAGPIRKTCDLFRLLAGHEVLGLAPGEIAKGLGVPFVRIATTVATNQNAARRQLDDIGARYSIPL